MKKTKIIIGPPGPAGPVGERGDMGPAGPPGLSPYSIPVRYPSLDDYRIEFGIEGVRYQWLGQRFRGVLKSFEKGLQVGDTRIIAGVLFHVKDIEKRRWKKPVVIWSIPEDILSDGWIGHFRDCIFKSQTI